VVRYPSIIPNRSEHYRTAFAILRACIAVMNWRVEEGLREERTITLDMFAGQLLKLHEQRIL
jgi:hypothetical protein